MYIHVYMLKNYPNITFAFNKQIVVIYLITYLTSKGTLQLMIIQFQII